MLVIRTIIIFFAFFLELFETPFHWAWFQSVSYYICLAFAHLTETTQFGQPHLILSLIIQGVLSFNVGWLQRGESNFTGYVKAPLLINSVTFAFYRLDRHRHIIKKGFDRQFWNFITGSLSLPFYLFSLICYVHVMR